MRTRDRKNCLHCWLSPLIQERLNAGESPVDLIGELLNVVSNMIASAPAPLRQRYLEGAVRALLEFVADDVKSVSEGGGIPAADLGARTLQ